MSSPDLLTADTIQVLTDYGRRSIELCCGSITKLQQHVDVLVVSAFNNNYIPTPRSVIGALQSDLGVSVENLARDKEEDQRSRFSCWWSKPIAGKKFTRVLCFEGSYKKDANPTSTIAEVFRSLIAVSKSSDIKVIMPLLAAGDQSFSPQLMLRLIVDTCIQWMKIGLPVPLLKIVVFTRNPQQLDDNAMQLVQTFEEVKTKWLQHEDVGAASPRQKEKELEYDIYLSYSERDQAHASEVAETLERTSPGVRVFTPHQQIIPGQAWQEDIYQSMRKCGRVVPLLTQNFMEDDACVEQYNMAMCVSHAENSRYLAPLFLKDVPGMPTYMETIQYFDCRPLSEPEKLKEGCRAVWDPQSHVVLPTPRSYDLFVSYAHADSELALNLIEEMKRLKPDWKVFVDSEGLQSGTSWQRKLYSSIENARFVLTLLSPSYLSSRVCQEEYNLGHALHELHTHPLRLVRLCVKEVKQWPPWCKRCLSIAESNMIANAQNVIRTLDASISPKRVAHFCDSIKSWRSEFMRQNFPMSPELTLTRENRCALPEDKLYNVFFSYHANDRHWARQLGTELKHYLPDIRISFPDDEGQTNRHKIIDDVMLFVPFLSPAYVQSMALMAEFDRALCRHRTSTTVFLCPIIVQDLPERPVYVNLAFCLFSIADLITHGDPHRPSNLKKFASAIGNILTGDLRCNNSFKTLFSVTELLEWQKLVSEHQTPTFNPLLCYSDTDSITSNNIPQRRRADDRHIETVVPEVDSEGSMLPQTSVEEGPLTPSNDLAESLHSNDDHSNEPYREELPESIHSEQFASVVVLTETMEFMNTEVHTETLLPARRCMGAAPQQSPTLVSYNEVDEVRLAYRTQVVKSVEFDEECIMRGGDDIRPDGIDEQVPNVEEEPNVSDLNLDNANELSENRPHQSIMDTQPVDHWSSSEQEVIENDPENVEEMQIRRQQFHVQSRRLQKSVFCSTL